MIYISLVPLSPFISTAQVPDDEQFVPDFQSDSCEYFSISDCCVCPLKLSCDCLMIRMLETIRSATPAEYQGAFFTALNQIYSREMR